MIIYGFFLLVYFHIKWFSFILPLSKIFLKQVFSTFSENMKKYNIVIFHVFSFLSTIELSSTEMKEKYDSNTIFHTLFAISVTLIFYEILHIRKTHPKQKKEKRGPFKLQQKNYEISLYLDVCMYVCML